MSSISKEMQLSYQYTNHCIRVTAVSLLDECNFEARQKSVFLATSLRAAFALIQGAFLRLNKRKFPIHSALHVLKV